VRLLERQGLAAGDGKDQETTIIQIYSDPEHHEFKILCEAMIEVGEMFSLWREHHVRMAQRMIGEKPGIGQNPGEGVFGQGPLGTMGVEYVSQTLGKLFFPVLRDPRTWK
jgi:tryptophan 2,3-dioxygenase